MADVSLDPQNSNPKELYGQGVRAYVLQDFDTAVKAFSKTSELLAIEHGTDLHDSLGDVYLYYGKSLLELSRRDSGPLGEGVLKSVEEESEEEVEGSDSDEGNKNENDSKTEVESKANGDSNKTDDHKQKVENEKPEEAKSNVVEESKSDKVAKESSKEEEEGKVLEDDKNEEEEEGKVLENDKNEEAGTSAGAESKEDEENEEELSDLQVAWEVLELAKRIFTQRGVDGKKNLAETLIILGEISLESGNFSSAIEDMVQGLQIQKTLFSNDSRTIAETYYKLGGAYSTNAQIDEAIESFNASLEYLQNKINSLKKDEDHKEANSEEIQEIENLIPELQEKIADMKNLKTEIANKMKPTADDTASKTNGTPEASSSKQVNDISHLVKRKRKEEELQEENPAKRPSP